MKDFLKQISYEAGQISLEYREKRSSIQVTHKSTKNLVTEADKVIENYLVEQISTRYPEHAILGEESGSHEGKEYRWILDPIDGTNSFLHGQPFYSISIGLEKEGNMLMGAVYAPVLDEFFFAEKGQGATCNEKPIAVSTTDQLINSMLGTGFACIRDDRERNNLPYFNAILPKIRGVRRYGSVAIDLSYVACGRLEGMWEMGLNVYDIAAAGLILKEAGGKLTDFSGSPDGLPDEMVGTNGHIHEAFLSELHAVDQRL